MEAGVAGQLTRRLCEHSAALAAAAEAVAELDCVLALAEAAADLNLCRPQV
jgi:DNA mismatch repair ATPase MutS